MHQFVRYTKKTPLKKEIPTIVEMNTPNNPTKQRIRLSIKFIL